MTVWLACLGDIQVHGSDGSSKLQAQLKVRAGKRIRLIKSIVDNAFASLAIGCPNLVVIVLETMGIFGEDDGVHSFTRIKHIGMHGESTFIGTPIENHMVKHYEPCSEILEAEMIAFGISPC